MDHFQWLSLNLMCNYWLPRQIPNETENIWSCTRKRDLYPDKWGKNGTNSNKTITKRTDWVAQADALLLRQLSVNVNDRAMLHHLYIYNQPCVWGLRSCCDNLKCRPFVLFLRGTRNLKKDFTEKKKKLVTVSSIRLMDYYHGCYYLFKIQAQQYPKT